MAKKKDRNFVSIPFSASLGLVTLANDIVVDVGAFGNQLGEDLYVVSIDATWTIHGLTATQGPIDVGFAHGDLSVTEVAEALDAEQTDPDDIIARERARRPVRRAGKFPGLSTNEALADGEKIRTRMRMSIGDGHDINIWARNKSDAPMTTGAVVDIDGVIYGRWQR